MKYDITENYSCSFFGHRNTILTDGEKNKLERLIENLIRKGVKTFLFGNKSKFYEECHKIVSDLMAKYEGLKRVMYVVKSQGIIFSFQKEKWQKRYNEMGLKDYIIDVEEKREFKNINYAGKASYIERNLEMIDESDYCIFYYNEIFTKKLKTKSGTALAYDYAMKKKKKIINLTNEI